ncbi:MAG: hypothetical protein RI907_2495 [Pseudomonadota bacterium]|jgi:hypothetical protein
MSDVNRVAEGAVWRRRLWRLGFGLPVSWALAACGGGGGGDSPAPTPAPLAEATQVAPTPWGDACVPSGLGRDFQVGPGAGQLATLADVPWDTLAAGDTVRIFYNNGTPYRGKILVAAQGTAEAPVRVCGVKGAGGERPIIDGDGAVARAGLSYTSAGYMHIQETRALVMVDRLGNQSWSEANPSHVRIDGLHLRHAHPRFNFTNSAGEQQAYVEFGACLWVERGHHITIADNEMEDCTNGLFARSQDIGAGEASIVQDLRVAGNHIHDNGIAGSETIHNIYVQALGVVYEFNRVGPLRSNARGNALKDRSVGTVVRYNHLIEGARALDLVEPEDMPDTAQAHLSEQATYIYGNLIVKNGDSGTVVHYGGDHQGSESMFRAGPLYFFHNTVYMTGGWSRLFQLSTTRQTAEVFHNVLAGAPGIELGLRAGQDVDAGWTTGGVLHLGRNFIQSVWWPGASPWHPVAGTLTGTELLLSTTAPTLAAGSYLPLAGSLLVDAATTVSADLQAVLNAHPVNQTFDATLAGAPQPVARTVRGAAADLGAFER